MPLPLDGGEPQPVAEAVAKLDLRHVVITSVDRDDLDDGGAQHFADTITAIRAAAPQTTIEILTPDFLRKDGAWKPSLRRSPTCSTTIWKPCRGCIAQSGRGAAISIP